MDKIVFVGLLLLAAAFVYCADKKNKKWLLIAPIMILSLLAGLRAKTVGVDTAAYYDAFENSFPNSWQFPEVGFRTISMFIMALVGSPTIVFLLYAVITNTCILLRLWDYRSQCNLPLMILLYELIFYIETLNIMRQFLAISIIFYSTKLLDRNKYFAFIIIIVLMTLIHETALLALLIPLVFLWRRISTKNKVLLFIPVSIIILCLSYNIMIYEGGHVTNYFSASNQIENLNITFVYRALIFVISFMLCSGRAIANKERSKRNTDVCADKEEFFKSVYIIYGAGLLFASAGMFYFVMARIGYYYLLYELLYWGYLAKLKKNKYMYITMIIIFAVYVFALEIIRNGSQVFPYSIGV